MQQYLSGEALVFSAKKDGSSEFEYSLPEYLPGISRIVKSTTSVEKTVSRREGNELYCDVSLKTGIIYVSDFGNKIKSVFFDETICVPMGEFTSSGEDYIIIPSAFVSAVSSRPLNSRKFICSCTYHTSIVVLEETGGKMLETDQDSGICTLKETRNLCRKITLPEQLSEYEGEITIDSQARAVGEIVFADAVFCGATCTVSDSFLEYEGKFMLHILYETAKDEEASDSSYAVITAPITIKNSIENDKIKSGQQGFVYLDAAKPQPSAAFDGYGENRVISFVLKYSALPVLFEKFDVQTVIDAFSEKTEITPVITKAAVHLPRYTVSENVRMSEAIKTDIGNLAEISDCASKILSVTTEYSDSKFFSAAKCLVNIFGISKSGELACLDGIVTLHVPLMQGTALDRNCVPEILLSIRDCTAEVREGAVNVTFDIVTNGVITEKTELNVVSDIEVGSVPAAKKHRGEIVICYPSKDEGLWDIAKKYRVNPDTIMHANNMEKDDISAKHILLIP